MKVSVITPTLDSERWIASCVGSVMMQRSPALDVEHVIADGGSTDRTVEIARELGATLVERDPTDDLPTVINKATLASTGDLVGFLGSDDVLLPGALDAIAARYRSSGRRWVTGAFSWTDADLNPIGGVAAPPTWMTAEMMACLGWCLVNAQSTYFERSMFEELGGYDASFPTSLDYDMYLRAMNLTPYAREPKTIAFYRRHGRNLSIIGAGASEENRRILDLYGPRQAWKRKAYRLLMAAYVNGRNPGWTFHKFRPEPKH